MHNFQPSSEQQKASGMFSAAKPFCVHSLPVKTHIHPVPTAQKWDQMRWSTGGFQGEKTIGCYFCHRNIFLSNLFNQNKIVVRKKTPVFLMTLNTAARHIHLWGHLCKNVYFKALRRQSTFKERTVQNLNTDKNSDLPVIMTNLSLLALENQRKLITRMTGSLVSVLKYLIEESGC